MISENQKLVGFMPWLQLAKPVRVGGFNFVPFIDSSDAVAAPFSALKDAFGIILSSYYDAQERPRRNCVIVTDESIDNLNESWNLVEAKVAAIQWAASLSVPR